MPTKVGHAPPQTWTRGGETRTRGVFFAEVWRWCPHRPPPQPGEGPAVPVETARRIAPAVPAGPPLPPGPVPRGGVLDVICG